MRGTADLGLLFIRLIHFDRFGRPMATPMPGFPQRCGDIGSPRIKACDPFLCVQGHRRTRYCGEPEPGSGDWDSLAYRNTVLSAQSVPRMAISPSGNQLVM